MRNRVPDGDDGFSLLETIVAMMVFAVVAVVAASLLVSTLSVTKNGSQRVVAANLAAKYVEEARGMRALDIPDGGTVYPPVTLQGTTYTAQRTANYVASDSSTSLCAGGSSQLVYKLVTVTVTWPGMGTTKPVRSDTLKALGLGADGLNQSHGVAAVGLVRGDGTPLPGVTVSLSPLGQTRQTGVDGCALFTGLVPGTTYHASVNQPSHTGVYGDQLLPSGSQGTTLSSIQVTAGGVTRRSLDYDRAGSLAVSFTAAPGYPAPAALGVSLSNTAWSEGTRQFRDCSVVASSPKDCVSGTPRTAARLFPGLYGAWGGVCAPAPPSVALTKVNPAEVAPVSVPLAPLAVDLRNSQNQPVVGRTLHFTAKTGTPCADAYSAVSDGSGAVQLSLPSGTWTISLSAGGTPVAEVTLDAYGTPAPRVSLVI